MNARIQNATEKKCGTRKCETARVSISRCSLALTGVGWRHHGSIGFDGMGMLVVVFASVCFFAEFLPFHHQTKPSGVTRRNDGENNAWTSPSSIASRAFRLRTSGFFSETGNGRFVYGTSPRFLCDTHHKTVMSPCVTVRKSPDTSSRHAVFWQGLPKPPKNQFSMPFENQMYVIVIRQAGHRLKPTPPPTTVLPYTLGQQEGRKGKN